MTGIDFAGMSWSVAVPAMLWGLLGLSIPLLIHLLNRRRAPVVDWGAMQFLSVSRAAQRRFQLSELLLLAGRMVLLALVVLAVARPLAGRPARTAVHAAGTGVSASANSAGSSTEPRDVVIVLDGSVSMGLLAGGQTPRQRALESSKAFLQRLPPGSSVAVLDARERVRPVIVPASFDRQRAVQALRDVAEPRGGSDLPAAVADALRLLETARNARRDVVILTDGQRVAWRPEETARWNLLRSLYREYDRRGRIAPGLWAVILGGDAKPDGADGVVGPLEVDRSLVPLGLPITVKTTVTNGGPGVFEGTAELNVDGVPVPSMSQRVGPLPPAGRTGLSFRVAPDGPGAHLLSVRLSQGGDPLPANDEASRPVEVAQGLPVVLIDGEPGLELLDGETGFLRAALMPAEDQTPAVRATVVPHEQFGRETLRHARVVVLANVDRLSAPQAQAVAELLARGGGVLVAPGDRTGARAAGAQGDAEAPGWLPVRLGERRDAEPANAVHPAPETFAGSWMASFGQGDSPALGRVKLTSYHRLEAVSGAAVLARLDSGDPWVVEGPALRGRVVVLATPLDAEGSTLPVSPDFLPWIHTLVYRLADPTATAAPLRPGEPIRLDVSPQVPPSVTTATVRTPTGKSVAAPVVHQGGRVQVRHDDTSEPGVYRIDRPGPDESIEPAYVLVEGDAREGTPDRLGPSDIEKLAQGWPLEFLSDASSLTERLLAANGGGSRPIWRWVVLAALLGLCLEVAATRRLARSRGLAGGAE